MPNDERSISDDFVYLDSGFSWLYDLYWSISVTFPLAVIIITLEYQKPL